MIIELILLAKLLTMGGGGGGDDEEESAPLPPPPPPPPPAPEPEPEPEPAEEATVPIAPVPPAPPEPEPVAPAPPEPDYSEEATAPIEPVAPEPIAPEPIAPESAPAPQAQSDGKVKLPARFLHEDEPLRTGYGEGFDVIAPAKISDDAAVLARSPDGLWVFIWSDSGDGWVPTNRVEIDGDFNTLPIWPNPINGYVYKPWCSVTRPTDLKNGADSGYETLICIPPGTEVKVLAQSPDGFWVFIWSDLGDGWVPRSAMKADCMQNYQFLAVWDNAFENAVFTPKAAVAPDHLNMHNGPSWDYGAVTMLTGGTEVKVMAKNEAGDWLHIMVGEQDGWVPADKVTSTSNLSNVSVREPARR